MNYQHIEYTEKVNKQGYHWKHVEVHGVTRLALVEGSEPVARGFLTAEDFAGFNDLFAAAPELEEDDIPDDYDTSDPDRWTYEVYRPMEKPNLYRTFAKLTPNKESVLQFANKYGLLGIPAEVHEFFDGIDDEPEVETYPVELASDWQREFLMMRLALGLWDAIHHRSAKNKIPQLEDMIIWRGDVCLVKGSLLDHTYPHWEGERNLINISDDFCLVKSIRQGDLVTPAFEMLRLIINKHLADRVTAVMEWGKPEYKTLNILYRPTCLIGALWLQFARVVTGTENLRTCLACGKVLTDVKRKTRLFCNDTCQKRHSRQQEHLTESKGEL